MVELANLLALNVAGISQQNDTAAEQMSTQVEEVTASDFTASLTQF